jgi:CspA family cold shock protein
MLRPLTGARRPPVGRLRWGDCPTAVSGGNPVPAGRIKKIIPDRGFGFVRADDGNEVFFHRTELTLADFDRLEEGQAVEFDIVDSPKGPRARNLRAAS